jgi:hypothetical protein
LDSRGGNFKKATLWLSEASAASVRDDDQSWPSPGNLNLNGFVYRLIEPRDAGTRLEWLKLQPDKPFFPQPYLQLARVLAEAGDEDGRIQILVAMKDREWRLNRRGLMDLVLRGPFKATIGYGYRPLMAFWEVMGLSALGWIVYRRSYLAGGVVPSDKDAYQEFKSTSQPPDYHKRFSPLIYSLENSLPLVTLGQAEKWQPDPSRATRPESTAVKPTFGSPARWPRWVHWLQRLLVFVGLKAPEQADSPRSRASRWGTSPRFLRWFLWAQILLGWLLATLFLAGISGIIKRE